MFRNYLKIATRHIIRNKIYSFINISGLAVGMACTILLLLWVQDELSYDRFHENGAQIFRANTKWAAEGGESAKTVGLLAPAVKEQFPEVIAAGRLHRRPTMSFKYIPPVGKGPIKVFNEDCYYLIDNDILKMFSFPFVRGNPETALQKGLIITERIAEKYFGDDDPIGKRFNVNNWFEAAVTGVIKNIPTNSHIQFDILGNLGSLKHYWPGGFSWSNAVHETYVQLAPHAKPDDVATKFTKLQKSNNKFFAEHMHSIQLQPLYDIYLNADVENSTTLRGDKQYIIIFLCIAIVILLIACINFMNLTTAQSLKRSSEIGVRKVAGALQKQLAGQFFGESLLLSALSLLGAILLFELALPGFNHFTGKNISLDYSNVQHMAFLVGLSLITGFIAGSYPAVYLSKFNPIKIIKGQWSQTSSTTIRCSLVVAQFTVSIVLILVTIVIFQQIHYMKNTKLGFNTENIICLPLKDNIGQQYKAFKNELLVNTNVISAGAKNCLPTMQVQATHLWWRGKSTDDDPPIEIATVDHDFIKTMNIHIINGRDFSSEIETDITSSLIVNESAVRQMGLDEPVGTFVRFNDNNYHIIGVIQDANFKSMRYSIQPVVFRLSDNFSDDTSNLLGSIFVKINGNNTTEALLVIKSLWEKFNPTYPFSYHFLDETYDQLYHSEQNIFQLFSAFTVLALFITCLGIFGLVSFTAEQRTKEIGIRKVLGASVSGILLMLSKDFMKWILIANLIAWPIAFSVMISWLQGYAYRIDISPWVFLMAGVSALLIALLTVSWQAIRAATANPVESLRYE